MSSPLNEMNWVAWMAIPLLTDNQLVQQTIANQQEGVYTVRQQIGCFNGTTGDQEYFACQDLISFHWELLEINLEVILLLADKALLNDIMELEQELTDKGQLWRQRLQARSQP